MNEAAFFLAKGLGWSWSEIMSMSARDRMWFVGRLRRQIEHEEKEIERARRG